MNKEIIEMLLFMGFGLYALNTLLFFFLFLRTLKTKDGIGLAFLKILTFAIFLGSLTISFSRCMTLYGKMDVNLGRVLAIVNPLTLLGVGLYLNFLFHQKYKK